MLPVAAMLCKLRTTEGGATRTVERCRFRIDARRAARWGRRWGHSVVREFEDQRDPFLIDEAEDALRVDNEVCHGSGESDSSSESDSNGGDRHSDNSHCVKVVRHWSAP
jgi:hypothetical protein